MHTKELEGYSLKCYQWQGYVLFFFIMLFCTMKVYCFQESKNMSGNLLFSQFKLSRLQVVTHPVTHREYSENSKLGEHWGKQPRQLPAEPTGPGLRRSILPATLLWSSTLLGQITRFFKKTKHRIENKKKENISKQHTQ